MPYKLLIQISHLLLKKKNKKKKKTNGKRKETVEKIKESKKRYSRESFIERCKLLSKHMTEHLAYTIISSWKENALE